MSFTRVMANVGRPISFYPSISRALGDINMAVILCQFIYWRSRVGDREIYKTQAEIEAETSINAHTQRRAFKKFQQLGLVVIEKKGIPARNHFLWNWKKVDELIEGKLLEQDVTDCHDQSSQSVSTSGDNLSPLDVTDCHDQSQQSVATNTETTHRLHTETTTTPLAPEAIATDAGALEVELVDDENQELSSDEPRVEIPPDMPGPKNQGAKTFKAWANYAITYQRRYNVWPVWNARVAGQMAQLVDRLGKSEAPKVAAFYLSTSDARVINEQHSVGLLLARAESLRTQWLTGRRMNSTTARQQERTAANYEAAKQVRENIEKRGSIYDNPFYK